VDTLAVALAPLPPQPLPALAAAGELVAGRAVAVALHGAVASGPAGGAEAAAGRRVARRVGAAVAFVVALRAPDARVARALPRVLVALALVAQAGVLAVGPPAVVVAGAPARQVVTLSVGVAVAFPLAVGAPELSGAFCRRTQRGGGKRPGEPDPTNPSISTRSTLSWCRW